MRVNPDQSVMGVQDGAGSTVHNPAYTEADDVIVFGTRSTMRAPANAPAAPNEGIPSPSGALLPPDPAIGGQRRQFGALGFSDGFLKFRRRSPFTGRVLVVPPMGVHPVEPGIGFSTRSQRLRNGVEALATDYTPASQEVAQEITRNM